MTKLISDAKPLIVTKTGVKFGTKGKVIPACAAHDAVTVTLEGMTKGEQRKLRKTLRAFGHTGLSHLSGSSWVLRKAA